MNTYSHENFKKNVSITYLARWSSDASIGVTNKINNTTSALCKNGYLAESKIISKCGFVGHILLALSILKCKSDLIIIRSTAYSMILCVLPMLIKRVAGASIVIDVPTPFTSVVEEIKGGEKSYLKKILLTSLININFPLSLYPANKIIQYSEESVRFSYGVRNKMFLGANGIDVASIKKIEDKQRNSNDLITLVGVAAIEYWHGYDRVIQGLSDYYHDALRRTSRKVQFIIVGSGGAELQLKQLVASLNLTEHVRFTGTLKGEALDNIFDISDIAVSSLAVHRKGLRIASDLKSREYLSRGMPILVSAEDPDISEDLDFVYRSRADDSAVNIEDMIKWHSLFLDSSWKSSNIRKFASEHLDYQKKVGMYTDVMNINERKQ